MTRLLPIPSHPSLTPEVGAPPAERVIEGSPSHQSWQLATSDDGIVTGGVWQVECGAWNVVRDEWEFMTVIHGRSELVEAGGGRIEVGPGDSFVLRAGFRGIWRVIEPTRVFWVLHDPHRGTSPSGEDIPAPGLLEIPADPAFAPEPGAPRPERVIDGNPTNRSWDLETTEDGKVACGVWEVDVGTWNVVKDSWEFMTVISGHSELTEDGGQTVVLKAGDACLMRPGFRGTWRVIAPTRKFWVIYEA